MSIIVTNVNIHVTSKFKYHISKCIWSFQGQLRQSPPPSIQKHTSRVGGLLLTITNPGCWARLPIPAPTCIWQPGRHSSCATSQPTKAQLHPTLETRQMAVRENRREERRQWVCVSMFVRQTETGRMREKNAGVCDHMLACLWYRPPWPLHKS